VDDVVVQYVVLYCTALHCIVLYCIILYCIVLHCIVLCYGGHTEQEQVRERSDRERQQAADLVEFPHRRRTLLVAGVTVATVMMTYALLTGLWKVKVVDDMVDEFVKVVKGQRDEDASVEAEFGSRSKKTSAR